MKYKALGVITAAGLLAAVSGCGDSGPDRILTEEEIAQVLPDEDAPGALEVSGIIDVDESELTRAEVEESMESSLEYSQEREAEVLELQGTEGVEECAEAIGETVDARQQVLDDLPEDTDFRRVTADVTYQHPSGAGIRVLALSDDPDTGYGAEVTLNEALACMGTEGAEETPAEQVEELDLGEASGYQVHQPEEGSGWTTVLYSGSGYLRTIVNVESDEPVEGELAEDLEALLDHIAEQGDAIDG